MTIRYSYEVRSPAAYFGDVPDLTLTPEMKELAAHLIESKTRFFDPTKFVDRYQSVLVEMLRAKQAGRMIEPTKKEAAPQRVVSFTDALRASIGADTGRKPAAIETGGRGAAKRRTAR
jgi:DNA end-binding protein Ku